MQKYQSFLDAGAYLCSSYITITNTKKINQENCNKRKIFQVYLSTSLDECIKRDVKGLYKKAMNNEITNFTGVNSPYEIPQNSDLEIDTGEMSVEDSSKLIFEKLMKLIIYEK